MGGGLIFHCHDAVRGCSGTCVRARRPPSQPRCYCTLVPPDLACAACPSWVQVPPLFIYLFLCSVSGKAELLSTASRGLIRAFPAAISHGVGTAAHEGGTLTVTTSRTRSAHRRSSLPRIRPPARMCAVMGDLCTAHSRTGIYEDQLMNPSPPWCSAPSGARR